jgi:hypothetical protein
MELRSVVSREKVAVMQTSPVPATTAETTEVSPDDAIRSVVTRLARPHRSGGAVIERAAILAEGASSAAVLRWIVAHHGEPEAQAAPTPARGLHGDRSTATDRPPSRYVLPPGALAS